MRHRRRAVVGAVALALVLGGCGSNLTDAELAAAQGALSVAAPAAAPVAAAPAETTVAQAAAPAAEAAAPVAAAPVTATKKTAKAAPKTAVAAPVAAAAKPAAKPAAKAALPVGPKAPIVLCSFGNSSGVLGAVTGPAPVANAAWASYVNAKGGLAGHPVRMIIADTGGSAANAQAIAQKCVEQEKAVAFFNEYSFGELDGALPYLKAKGVPVVGSIGGAISSDHSIMVFNPLNGADVGQAWGFVNTILAQTDKKKLGILYCQEASTCAQQIATFFKLLPYKGLEIAYKAQVSLVQPDYTAQLIQAKNAGVEVLVLLMDSASVGRIARNAAQQNFKPILAGTYNLGIQATLDQGPILDGLILASRTPAYSSSPDGTRSAAKALGPVVQPADVSMNQFAEYLDALKQK
ncbi:MAG: ABC transporter substrate-binding protein [Sporichthyaceae bacterium]